MGPLPSYGQNIAAFVGGLVFWVLNLLASQYVFPRCAATKALWVKSDFSDRYNMCSLIMSSVHGVLIPTGIIACLTSCDIWNDFLADSCQPLEAVFAVTASYFTVDFIMLLKFPDKSLQVVYLVHHIVGCLPFFANAFLTPNGHFLVGGGILIELANPFLNWRAALTLAGRDTTRAGVWSTYLCWLIWIPIRLCLPIYLSWGMITITIPALGADPWPLVLSYTTGFAITVFCCLVFVVNLTPQAVGFLRATDPHPKTTAYTPILTERTISAQAPLKVV